MVKEASTRFHSFLLAKIGQRKKLLSALSTSLSYVNPLIFYLNWSARGTQLKVFVMSIPLNQSLIKVSETTYCVMGERMVRFIPYSVIILDFFLWYSVLILLPHSHFIQSVKQRMLISLKCILTHTGLPVIATHAINEIRFETVLFPRANRRTHTSEIYVLVS